MCSLPANPGPAGQDGAGYSSAVVSNGGGVKQYVQFVGRGVIGVDAATGKLLWGYNKVANGTANVPTPIVSGDYVFCSSGYDDGGSALLKLTGKRGAVTAQEVWYKNNKQLQNHHGGMVLIGKHVYMGHGHNNGFPVCIDMMTVKDMWSRSRGVGGGSAALVAADGHLYFRYEDGKMALIEANPRATNSRVLFRFQLTMVRAGLIQLSQTASCICAINMKCCAWISARSKRMLYSLTSSHFSRHTKRTIGYAFEFDL